MDDGPEASSEFLGGTLKLRGPRKIVDDNVEELRNQQVSNGLAPGAWVLPVHCHDDFQTESMMPFFFSAEDFAGGWQRSGRPTDAAPDNLAVMDLRVLVKQMETTDVFEWSIFQFVSSPQAYALAQELMAARRPDFSAATANGGGSLDESGEELE